jgi:hypothetical protein
MTPDDIAGLLTGAGLVVVGRGSVGVSDLHFVVAEEPTSDVAARGGAEPAFTALGPLSLPRWSFLLLAIVALAGHAVVLRAGWSRLAKPTLAVAAVVGLLFAAHLRLAGLVHMVLRRRRR